VNDMYGKTSNDGSHSGTMQGADTIHLGLQKFKANGSAGHISCQLSR
jgi:hypothetical protein